MSEEFFNQIADELRNNQITPAPVAETAPVAESVQETIPEVPAQTTTQVNDQITDSVTQVEKEWWEKEDNTAEVITNQEKPTETKESVIDLDDDLKLILEYKKSGKTLQDFISEYKVDDITKWNDDQIVKNGLKEFMNLSEEDLQQATYEYDNASFFQKKQWADSFKEKFEQRNQEKLKQLTNSNAEKSQQQMAIANKYNEELNNFSQEIVGKEIYGMKVTDEMSKDLKSFIDKEFTLQRPDGSFDVEKMYSIGLWLKYGKDLVKANITKARNEGKEQVIREVSNPSKNMTGGGRSVGSGLEAAQEAFNTLFPG
jgi:hypothetical protein